MMKIKVHLVRTHYKNLHQHGFVKMVAQKMRKIYVGSGKSSECQMIMMTQNFHTQIQKLQECSVLVALVPIE